MSLMLKPEIKETAVREIGRTMRITDEGLSEEIVNGKAAVKQWLDLMLRQRPGLVDVYNFDDASVGVDRLAVNNLPKAVMLAEIQRGIVETAKLCPCITSVDGFSFNRGRRSLYFEFTVHLYSGEEVTMSYDV